MTSQILRTEQCTIVEPIEPVAGKYGPQFKFKASVPWTQYPPTFYVLQTLMPDADTAEKREALLNTDHWAQFKRGALLKGQDGAEKDPELDWSYRWDIVGWNTQDADWPSRPTAPQTGGASGRNQSIERQVAFKGAVDLAVSQLIDVADIPDYVDIFAVAIANGYVTSFEPDAVHESPLVETAKSLGAVVISEDVLEVTNETAPVCQEHKVDFEYKTSKTGVSKWAHMKLDGGWCVYDGDLFPAEVPANDA